MPDSHVDMEEMLDDSLRLIRSDMHLLRDTPIEHATRGLTDEQASRVANYARTIAVIIRSKKPPPGKGMEDLDKVLEEVSKDPELMDLLDERRSRLGK